MNKYGSFFGIIYHHSLYILPAVFFISILAKSRIWIHLLLCSIRVMKCRACKIFDTLQLNDRCPWCPSIFKIQFWTFSPPDSTSTKQDLGGRDNFWWQHWCQVAAEYICQGILLKSRNIHLDTYVRSASRLRPLPLDYLNSKGNLSEKKKEQKDSLHCPPVLLPNVFVKKHGRYIYKTNTKCCNNIKWQQEFMRTLKPLQIHLNTFTVSKYTIHKDFLNPCIFSERHWYPRIQSWTAELPALMLLLANPIIYQCSQAYFLWQSYHSVGINNKSFSPYIDQFEYCAIDILLLTPTVSSQSRNL